jgi:tetratricopeptide (TPR) repeat protein
MRTSVASDRLLSPPRQVLRAAAIVAITILTYVPAMRNGFIWDDDQYVTNNTTLRTPDGLQRIWLDPESTPQYYPLVFTTFRIEHALWGLEPLGYHVVNILLHAANALLVWRILAWLGVPGAWVAALVFAVHPVYVESVAWVAERKNVLSGFFYLAALWAALRFYLGTEAGTRRWTAYGAAVVLFVCALLSKTVTFSLPGAILLILWWKHGRISRRDALTLVPFLVLGVALALNTARLEVSHVGAEGAEWSLSLLQRALIAGRAPWFYASKLVWPASLTFIYPRWQVDVAVAWQYLFPMATLTALATLWLLRGRLGRGPSAAALFFVMSLTPALGFFNHFPMRFSFVADHFQYLASLGLIVMVVGGIASWRRACARRAAIVCAVVAVAAFGTITWRQSQSYRDVETLWRDTIRRNPAAWMAWDNLAAVVLEKGLRDPSPARAAEYYREALRYCETALALDRDNAEAYNNRGLVYDRLGSIDLALRDYNRAIELTPDYAGVYNNRGNTYSRMLRFAEAIGDYNTAVGLRPRFVDAYKNRAVAWYFLKDYDKAMADVRTTRKLGGRPSPELVEALAEAAGQPK